MKFTGFAITLGIGAAAGMVAAMMLPKQSAASKLVSKAADKVEDAAMMLSDKVNHKITELSQ